MPQECLNFFVNSLVHIVFSLLVGTPKDKNHDLAFPWTSLVGTRMVSPTGEQYFLFPISSQTFQPLSLSGHVFFIIIGKAVEVLLH